MDISNTVVLIVEDDHELRGVIREIVEGENLSTLEAANGAEALEFLKQGHFPNLVLCDLTMPGMDGLSFLTEAFRLRPDLCAAVLTAQSESANIIKALRLGVLDFIPKPFDREELLERVYTFLEISRVRRKGVNDTSGRSPYTEALLRIKNSRRKTEAS